MSAQAPSIAIAVSAESNGSERAASATSGHHRPVIVVGVDGSAEATVGAEWAAEKAVLRHWSVILVHVCEQTGTEHPEPCPGRSRSPMAGLVGGSTSQALIGRARCPVVVVRPQLLPAVTT